MTAQHEPGKGQFRLATEGRFDTVDEGRFHVVKVPVRTTTPLASARVGVALSSSLLASFEPVIAAVASAFMRSFVEAFVPLRQYVTSLIPAEALETLREALETLRESVPPNWRDLPDPDYLAALEMMNDGIPLIWVPRSSIVAMLIHEPDAGSRAEILARHRRDIAEDCAVSLGEMTDPALEDLTHLAAESVRALHEGHCAPAQALAANVLDTWLRDAARRGVRFQAVPEQPGFYRAICTQIEPVSDSVCIVELKSSGTLAPVLLALARFSAAADPRPSRFGRHATAHAAYREQYTPANAVTAVMLMTSVLRQADALGW